MNKYLDHFEFVMTEVIRFLNMDWSEHKNLPFEDVLSTLPDPRHPGGFLICGRKAEKVLIAVAELSISRSKYVDRLDKQEFVRGLKDELVQRVMVEKRDLDAKEADRIVGAVLRKRAKTCKPLTHLIPCRLNKDKKAEPINIGPVVLYPLEAGSSRLQSILNGYREKGEIEKMLAEDASDYFNSFDWIIQISLEAAEPSISRTRAEYIAQHTLDCFHLLVGAGRSHRFRVEGPAPSLDRRSRLYLEAGDVPHISSSQTWNDPYLGDGWWQKVSALGYGPIVTLMGIALEASHNFINRPPMAMRFLDAAAWYGEAVRDKFAAARAVKYVTAIERVLMTDTKKDVTETLVKRGVALLLRAGYDGDHEKDLREVYDMRSRLVHGSSSPHQDGGLALLKAEDLSRKITLSFLLFCSERRFRDISVSTSDLDEAYRRLVEFYAAETSSVQNSNAKNETE